MRRTPNSVLLCVYRARNERYARRLAAEAGEARLWPLDDAPGSKFELVNRLYASAPVPEDAYVVVADDDVVLPFGGYGRFLRLMARAAFDLAQPAHTRHRSHPSHAVTLRAPWSLARLTSFVEIGPLFAVSPVWRSSVLPFPGDVGMGWGLEADWYGLHRRGARLGIVDAAPLRHLGPVGAAYEQGPERDQLARRLAAQGLTGLHEVQRTLDTWRPWQRTPPWR